MASLFKVKALYDFEAKEEDDLGFPAGQVIDVTEEVDDNWLEGKYSDTAGSSHSGIFPREFVEKYEPPLPARPSRPTRPKQEAAPAAAAVPAPAPTLPPREPEAEPEQADDEEEEEEEQAPPVPAMSKPQAPPVDIPTTSSKPEEAKSPASASIPKSPPMKSEPPPAPKPAPAEPAEPTAPASQKKPPPVAAKSNAFRDRIAAFNQPAAAPIAPIAPGGQKPSSFIKKPFVAPPPMANSYVPPPKVEPVHKPYIREEDPEIRRRQEEDRAAAEAAGLTADAPAEQQEEDEDAPKPTSLKERIARLQQQQLEQAQRRSEGTQKKEKKPPVKKPSESSDQAAALGEDEEELGRERSNEAERQSSLDISRERPRVPSAQRRPPEPMSPVPTAPEHELVSDGNEADQSAAGETTEDDGGTIGPDDSDAPPPAAPLPRAAAAPKREPDVGDEEDTTEDAGDDGEDSMDEETRRRMELRDRMAKMSGGMGMAGMFGGGMPMPGGGAPRKRSSNKEKRPSEDAGATSPPPQQRVPIMPVPGMNRVQSPESDRTQTAAERDGPPTGDREDEEDLQAIPPSRKSTTEERGAPPPVPKGSRPSMDRGPPPPVPSGSSMPTPRPTAPDARPVPPPPTAPLSPGPGSESDDEASLRPAKSGAETSGGETPGPLPIRTSGAPPVPTSGSIQSPEGRRSSYFGSEPTSSTAEKRASRPPPPIPGSPLTSPRPPPPPPPTSVPSRRETTHEEDDEQRESDYEGDYDTDIASSAKHKDALKAHVREPSLDDSTTGPETPLNSPPAPPPHATAPRAVPPPPPSQAASKSRPSMDAPRAPPPVPPPTAPAGGDDDYDPFRYDNQTARSPPPVPGAIPVAAPPIPPPREPEPTQESSADDLYATTPPKQSMDRPPPAPPREAPPPARAPPRQSLDVQRSNTTSRRSMDQPRPSMENGQIANDIPLSEETPWWTAQHPLPPVLQSRNGVDILSESEESTTSKRGGRKEISKDIYVLFIDYSQTHISARYDASNPADVQLEQKHLPPAPKLRQDQLEAYWQRFGKSISGTANSLGQSKKENIVGDGSSSSFVAELIKAQKEALQPVGTRAYGSLVYANLANASTMQFDEIRPGDIITLRNARFEGSHGAMKHKYKADYGAAHVAIVEEWDGTKRAVRGWEQGREKKDKGVRSEKFRLGDLKSGEVRIWRVVGRDWVEWSD